MLHIKDQTVLNKKIANIREAGIAQFHIVTDFDNTLTKAFVDGEKVQSAIAQIRKGGYLTSDYPEKAFALYDKYHPIEVDPHIPVEEKTAKMLEWWTNHIILLAKSGMHKSVVDDILNKNKIPLRDGVEEFLTALHNQDIPVLIFSSAVGDLIEGTLKNANILFDNIHIISNFFDYNTDGTIVGYKGDIIHTLNKKEVQVHNTPYTQALESRKNVLLLGDSLSDVDMVQGIPHDTIIKIGFLNENEERLMAYQEEYDIVITEDPNMNEIISLLKKITN